MRHHGNDYAVSLPPGELRKLSVQQAFLNDEWLPEARYPNTDLTQVLRLTSWDDCGKGFKHGYCKDRPDAWCRAPTAGPVVRCRAQRRLEPLCEHSRSGDHWF
mmetsp:Transcript_10257/g.23427  ORF Transcript_10257/g.23427 Transcript_10257/m.23427 type:complete len:103 (-) Transcript_10257:470-778(-)